MPLALNTGHALYSNLTAFICVDDDSNIKDLKNPSTGFTKDGAVAIGSGTYGRHFRTLQNGYDPTQVAASTNVPSIAGSGNITIICVVNNIAGQGGGNPMSLFGGTHGTLFQQGGGGVKWGRWNTGGSVNFSSESASTIGNGAHTFCMSRTGSTAHAIFKDGAADSSGGVLGNETNAGYVGPFGGELGQGSVGADFVYLMIFNKALSLAEYQEIHNGLGASNASTMLTSGSDTTAPLITGPSGSAGALTSAKNIAENTTAVHTFTANESVTWSLNGGADVSKFSINSSTGALAFLVAPDYEVPTDANTDNAYIVGVRATDGSGNAATQTVTITVTDVADASVGFNLNSSAYAFSRNNTTPIPSTAVTFWVHNATTGALVGSAITGLSTNGSSIVTGLVSTSGLVAGTTYRLDYRFASGEFGVVYLAAA